MGQVKPEVKSGVRWISQSVQCSVADAPKAAVATARVQRSGRSVQCLKIRTRQDFTHLKLQNEWHENGKGAIHS
jgi:hypothetical protein